MPIQEEDWRPRLPEAELRGRFIIAESALNEAARLLPTYRGMDGDHEGIVLMLGRKLDDLSVILSVVAPEADHGPGHIMVSGSSVAALTGSSPISWCKSLEFSVMSVSYAASPSVSGLVSRGGPSGLSRRCIDC